MDGNGTSPYLRPCLSLTIDRPSRYPNPQGLLDFERMISPQDRSDGAISRRELLGGGAATFALASGPGRQDSKPAPATPADAPGPFLLGLNTSTIRGQKLPIVEEI